MADTSKKHHYVPRSILRHFSSDVGQSQIFVFDKTTMRSFPSSIEDAGSENYFNTVEIAGEPVCFENAFQRIDDQTALVLNKIIGAATVATLSPAERFMLSEVVATQFVRTKMIRTSSVSIAKQLASNVEEVGFDLSKVEGLPIPTDQEARRYALSLLAHVKTIAALLDSKVALLLRNMAPHPFWISDNPVVVHSSFPYGGFGIGERGAEVYMPISTGFTLGFWCPSIFLEMDRLQFSKHKATDIAVRQSIYDGLVHKHPVSFSPGMTAFLNSRQVLCSSRFLYGSEDAFILAKEIIDDVPEAKSIQSLHVVGPVGKGLPALTMPMGTWAVFYGKRSHHMIAVQNWDEHADLLQFTTTDCAALNRAILDEPLEQAILFDDQIDRIRMRSVRIEVVDEGVVKQVTVTFRDEGLNKIRAGIKERRNSSTE